MPVIAVFCGARTGTDPRYLLAARALGQALAERAWPLVYGGGRLGLMGALAQGALDAGGHVTGVIPGFLSSLEVLQPGLQTHHTVTDLFARKALMIELADAFVTLPGGIGTLDELLEVMAWRQLGCFDKPVALLNTARYFDPWRAMLTQAVDEGFVDPLETDRLLVADEVDGLLAALERAFSASAPARDGA